MLIIANASRPACAVLACVLAALGSAPCQAQEIHTGPQFLPEAASIEASAADVAKASLGEALLERARVVGLAPSPDGTRIAFVLVRMNLDRDGYQSVLAVKSVGAAEPIVLGSAGPPVWDWVGNMRPMVPKWSPDGRRIALVMPVADVRQVISWTIPEGRREPLTNEPRDILDFAWLPAQDGIVVAERVADDYTAQRAGGLRSPVRVEQSLMTSYGAPFLDEQKERLPALEWRMLLNGERESRPAALDEQERLRFDIDVEFGPSPRRSIPAPFASLDLARVFPGEAPQLVGSTSSGREAVFLWSRRFGERHLYMVDIRGRMRQVSAGQGYSYLFSCGSARDKPVIACLAEGPNELPRIVAFDVGKRSEATLVAPDAALDELRSYAPELASWRLDGETHYGWIIPAARNFAGPRPMVIAVYHFPGRFLDASGEELALFDLAKRGILVVCVQTPPRRKQGEPFEVAIADWDRPNRLFRVIVDSLASSGRVDRSRVGIVGLSFGSELVAYTVSHSNLFVAAASAGGGSIEPTRVAHTLPGAGSMYASPGLWWWEDPAALERWRRLSPALNARAVSTPVLFQLADRESPTSFFFIGQLSRFGKPFEAWTYDRELHQKIWPSNKRLVNERDLDWFQFWLQDSEDPAPTKAAQYARWRRLREKQP